MESGDITCQFCVRVVDRQKMYEDFKKQAQLIFQQWETDVEKTRENEEKLQVP